MKTKTKIVHTIILSNKDLNALVSFYHERNAWPFNLPEDTKRRLDNIFNHLNGIINPPKDEDHNI